MTLLPPVIRTAEEARADAKSRLAARAAADKAFRTFLESSPPNVAVTIKDLYGQYHPQASNNPWSIQAIDIELHCEDCGGPRQFRPGSGHLFTRDGREFLTYTCKNCGGQEKLFALMFEEDLDGATEVMKLGEFPPFGAPVSSRIAKLLGKADLELYRKGMRSEAQGLGVGAATYFRRIVDNQWKQLVMEMKDAASKLGYKDLGIFDAAIAEVSFSKAVDMLKDALPQKLLILDGDNPLTLLYKPLSVQLHNLSDEDCLQQAADIRVVLTALLENIADVLSDHAELRQAAARLKQAKS